MSDLRLKTVNQSTLLINIDNGIRNTESFWPSLQTKEEQTKTNG